MMNGDHTVSEYLLSYKFDYIFSQVAAKQVNMLCRRLPRI